MAANISPLAFYDPELYAKQQAIARRQAFAQMLLEKGAADAGASPYGGLANAGRELLGAYLGKKADQDEATIWSAPPVASASAPSGPALGAALSGNAPTSPSPPQNTVPGPMAQAGSPPAPPPQAPAQSGGEDALPPQLQQLYDRIPKIPNVPPSAAIQWFLSDNAGYMKAYADAISPTPEQKNIGAAYGAGPDAKTALQAVIAHGAATNVRPGGFLYNPLGPSFGVPNSSGVTPTLLPNGQMGMQLAPGAAPALAQSGYAQKAPQAALTPATGYDANGMPLATNSAVMSGNGPGVNALLGGMNMPPPPQGPAPSPVAPPPRAPMAPPPPAAPPPPQAALAPVLPAGQGEMMGVQGKAAGERAIGTVNEAEGSPDRINVLNNIISLSQQGALSGPGSGWLGHLAGVTSTFIPGLKGATSDAEKYQELVKFTYQNALRAWQTAGGTGTDNQMAAQMHANVNTEMNPGALRSIARWALAGEHAIQGKANAQAIWLKTKGNTPASQTAFENAWRSAMDRRVFIYDALTPDEKKAFAASLSPADAKALIQKRGQLTALGAFAQ